MLGIDRRAARYAFTSALVLLLLYLVYLVRKTFFIFILALLFAYLLSPLVNALDRVLPRSRTRAPALALAYIIFLGIVVVFAIQIGSRAVEQARELGAKLPAMIESLKGPAETPQNPNSLQAQILERLKTEVAERSGDLISWLAAAGVKFVTVAGDLIYVVIVPILGFFFLKDGAEIRQHVLDLVQGESHRELLDDILADVNVLLAHYMRALVVLAVAAFTAYGIFFTVTGIPYGILLAALAGVLEFIPMVGPLTASVMIVVVTAVAGGPVPAILIFLAVYRVIQDYILSPHLMGQGIELHPLLVLFGVFAGAEIAGIPGTFLSVPALALVRILYRRIRKARLGLPKAPIPV
ncbi:MAG TPA: AI-2E family transporter [Candidatus Sulfopaludibacter sp.]|nr:AI-2E family transporter [Candidatus Sulfopaludibacter sp.]